MRIVGDLAHHFVEAVDQAAIASAAWRGKGDNSAADDAAVEAMRRTFDAVTFDGRVAIGEGERDDAPTRRRRANYCSRRRKTHLIPNRLFRTFVNSVYLQWSNSVYLQW